jgi:hypothetical protein
MTLSAAQKRAADKYRAKHKDRIQYLNRRSVARNFIKNMATQDDLDELQRLIDQRRQ